MTKVLSTIRATQRVCKSPPRFIVQRTPCWIARYTVSNHSQILIINLLSSQGPIPYDFQKNIFMKIDSQPFDFWVINQPRNVGNAHNVYWLCFVKGPDFWGLVNPEWNLCSKGRRQSPINIDPRRLLFDPQLNVVHVDKRKVRLNPCLALS